VLFQFQELLSAGPLGSDTVIQYGVPAVMTGPEDVVKLTSGLLLPKVPSVPGATVKE
jgi:hypothetical protein